MIRKKDTLFCPECAQERETKVGERKEEYSVRGEKVNIDAKVRFCTQCNTPVFDEDLDEATIQAAYDAYREKHGFLKPKDIKELREVYGLSQRGMAALLNWSPNTIARYEGGALPDPAHMTTLLMLRDNHDYVEKLYKVNKEAMGKLDQRRIERALEEKNSGNVLRLKDVVQERYDRINEELRGFSDFDFDKMRNMVLFFAETHQQISKTKLMKCLFYTDFLHYKNHHTSVSGLPYQRMPFGPVPYNHWLLLDSLSEEMAISLLPFDLAEGEFVRARAKADLSLFTATELETMRRVVDYIAKHSAKSISDYSHEEKAHEETEEGDLITYRYGKDLREF